jgi:hypothetical protein
MVHWQRDRVKQLPVYFKLSEIMGDARSRMRISLEQLKASVAAGPPVAPTGGSPGPLTRALINALEQSKQSMDRTPTPEEAVIIFAHTMDLLAWKESATAYEKCKKLLEQAESRIQLVK